MNLIGTVLSVLTTMLPVAGGVIAGRMLIRKYWPREQHVHFINDDTHKTSFTITTHKGKVELTLGEGLVDVHDAYDYLEILQKNGITVKKVEL